MKKLLSILLWLAIAMVAILAIMVILLAVLALVVVKALAESPWGVFTVAATIPIAMFMGGYLRFWRVGKVMEASILGVALLLLAVWGGKLVYASPEWSKQAEIVCVCESHQHAPKTDEQRYVEMTERRFNGVTRCC